MNWVDIAIIVVAALGAIIGLKQGLIRMVFTAVGLLIGITIAGQYSGSLAERLSADGAQWASVVAFIIVLVAVMIVANLVGAIVRMFFKVLLLGWLDAIGGLAVGLLVGALLIGAVFTVILEWEASQLPVLGGTLSGVGLAITESGAASLIIDKFRLVLGLLPGRFDVVSDFFRDSAV